jgi:hypothetical protein
MLESLVNSLVVEVALISLLLLEKLVPEAMPTVSPSSTTKPFAQVIISRTSSNVMTQTLVFLAR